MPPPPREVQELRDKVDEITTDEYQGLEQLEAIKAGVAYWDSRLKAIVAFLRKRGVSWEAIGVALGISPQAAHKRYSVSVRLMEEDPS